MAILIVLVLAALLGLGCDERDPINPLDPDNTETGGEPDWLSAVADNGAVDLTWVQAPREGFDRFELWRGADGEDLSFIQEFADAGEVAYRDEPLPNGARVRYQLHLVLANEQRISLPEKSATPGAAVPWILENGAFGLLRAAPDGRSLRQRAGTTNGFFDADASPDGTGIWASDFFGSRVDFYDVAGERLRRIEVDVPFRMAVDWTREVVWTTSWILDVEPIARAFSFDGTKLAEFPLEGEVRDMAVDESTGACYLARGVSAGLTRVAVGDTTALVAGEGLYMMVDVLEGDRVVAGDPFDNRIALLDPTTLDPIAALDIEEAPQSLTVASDRIYVVEGESRILLLDRTLAPTDTLDGRGAATSIAVDEETGAVWLALPTLGRVDRILPNSLERHRFNLFQPFLVTVGLAETSAARR